MKKICLSSRNKSKCIQNGIKIFFKTLFENTWLSKKPCCLQPTLYTLDSHDFTSVKSATAPVSLPSLEILSSASNLNGNIRNQGCANFLLFNVALDMGRKKKIVCSFESVCPYVKKIFWDLGWCNNGQGLRCLAPVESRTSNNYSMFWKAFL